MSTRSPSKITVEENHYRFIWGLITVMCLLTGSVLFDPLQNSGSSFEQYGLIIIISLLFTSGIWGIYQTIQPIYSAILSVNGDKLTVQVFYGEDNIKSYDLDLNTIETVTYQPRTPPGPDEALYDFSTNYLAVYQKQNSSDYIPLIDISPEIMTLKIQDIADIIRFLNDYKADVQVPDEDRKVLGI